MPRRAPVIRRAAALLALLAGCAGRPTAEPRAAPHATEGPRDASRAILGGYRPRIPADSELLKDLERALDIRRRDEGDLFLDAVDPGELVEHATLSQLALDRGIFQPDDLFQVGDDLFDYEFRPENGLGNGLAGRPGTMAGGSPAPNLRRVHAGEFGGPDSLSCATCHSKGGPDGAGQNTQNAFLHGDGDATLGADERSAPHVLGLGPISALAREMSSDLQAERDEIVADSKARGEAIEKELTTKGVSFGVLRASAGGGLEFGAVSGVDEDLVVRPFGWKGHQGSLRGMVEESFRIHLGLVSMHDQALVRDGKLPADEIGDGTWYDADRDGATIEIDEGMLTTMTAYLSQLEAPVVRPPETAALLDRFARGRAVFAHVGCDACHRPYLELKDPVVSIRPRGDEHASSPEIRVDVSRDGDPPKVEPVDARRSAFRVWLFSDLRRHDMGPRLATRTAQGHIPASVFLTRPLWGLAFTAPYLHDGRAPTVGDAIEQHGGEASSSRDAYLALPPGDQAALRVFLLSFTREPKLFAP